MRPHTTLLIALAMLPMLGQGTPDEATARVVRDGRTVVSNPAVEVGGHRLSAQASPPVPYSAIGAMAPETGNWFSQWACWSLRMLGSLAYRPGPAERLHAADNRPLEWVPPPMP